MLFSMRFRLLALVLLFTGSLFAQSVNKSVFQTNPDWTDSFPPYRVAGNLYYVGSKDLASFLITTPQGDILINSNLSTSVPQIKKSVEQLGFRFSDIRILLISHAHLDHCAGSAGILRLTHAKYMVMDADVPEVEDGGKSNFQYGKSEDMRYPPAKVDRILHDGDEVRLGNLVLVAHKTAGHTKGCTTWTLKVNDKGRTLNVVIVGSPNVNPGYKLVNNAQYPQIAQDYQHGFQVLKSLPCDIFLGAHGSYYAMNDKYARLKSSAVNPFIDPEGYRSYVADREQAFLTELKRQQKGAM
jgi:metallo-beta-lactamase class B